MSAINSFNPVDAAARASTPSRFSEMSTEDFIRIIFTELSSQDPFQPRVGGDHGAPWIRLGAQVVERVVHRGCEVGCEAVLAVELAARAPTSAA